MIDTVQIKHARPQMGESYLLNIGARRLPRRKHPTYALNPTSDRNKPRITIVCTPNGVMHEFAEFSIGRLMFGHNSRLPTEAECFDALRLASDYVAEQLGHEFTSSSALVRRIDFAADFHIGETEVQRAMLRLRSRSLPRYQTRFIGNTVYFRRSDQTIRVYSKLHEVMASRPAMREALDAANGNIRLERSLTRRAVMAAVKAHSLQGATATQLFREEVCRTMLSDLIADLDIGGLFREPVTDLVKLSAVYPMQKAVRLAGFAAYLRQFGSEYNAVSDRGEFSKATFDRSCRELRKARVFPTEML